MPSSFSAHLHNNDIDPKDRSISKSGALGTIMFTFDLWRTTAKDISSQLSEVSNTKTCFLTQCLNNVIVFSKTDFSVFGLGTIRKKHYKKKGISFASREWCCFMTVSDLHLQDFKNTSSLMFII